MAAQRRAPRLELPEYLRRAARRSAEEVLKFRDSLLKKDYRSPSFMFARCLRARPEFAGLNAEQATQRVDEELDAMYPECPAPWIELGLPDSDTRGEIIHPRSDFLAVWEGTETPFDVESVVDEAAYLAKTQPCTVGAEYHRAEDGNFVLLLKVCFYMHQLSRDDEFFLSAKDAGRAVGVSPPAASQLLRRATRERYLWAGPYDDEKRAQRKAMTYRFIGEPASGLP